MPAQHHRPTPPVTPDVARHTLNVVLAQVELHKNVPRKAFTKHQLEGIAADAHAQLGRHLRTGNPRALMALGSHMTKLITKLPAQPDDDDLIPLYERGEAAIAGLRAAIEADRRRPR